MVKRTRRYTKSSLRWHRTIKNRASNARNHRSKVTKKAVRRIATNVVKRQAELKWTVGFLSGTVSAPQAENVIVMMDAIPPILQGVGGGSRVGNKIWVKHLKLTIRWQLATPPSDTEDETWQFRVMCVKPKLFADNSTMNTANELIYETSNAGDVYAEPAWNVTNVLYDSGIINLNRNSRTFVLHRTIHLKNFKVQYKGSTDTVPIDNYPQVYLILPWDLGDSYQYQMHTYMSFKDL